MGGGSPGRGQSPSRPTSRGDIGRPLSGGRPVSPPLRTAVAASTAQKGEPLWPGDRRRTEDRPKTVQPRMFRATRAPIILQRHEDQPLWGMLLGTTPPLHHSDGVNIIDQVPKEAPPAPPPPCRRIGSKVDVVLQAKPPPGALHLRPDLVAFQASSPFSGPRTRSRGGTTRAMSAPWGASQEDRPHSSWCRSADVNMTGSDWTAGGGGTRHTPQSTPLPGARGRALSSCGGWSLPKQATEAPSRDKPTCHRAASGLVLKPTLLSPIAERDTAPRSSITKATPGRSLDRSHVNAALLYVSRSRERSERAWAARQPPRHEDVGIIDQSRPLSPLSPTLAMAGAKSSAGRALAAAVSVLDSGSSHTLWGSACMHAMGWDATELGAQGACGSARQTGSSSAPGSRARNKAAAAEGGVVAAARKAVAHSLYS
jgi:hypothetical protein